MVFPPLNDGNEMQNQAEMFATIRRLEPLYLFGSTGKPVLSRPIYDRFIKLSELCQ
jgi:hypothetical protein